MTQTVIGITEIIQSFIVPVLSLIIAAQAVLMRRMGDKLMMQEGRITILEHVNGLEYANGKVMRKLDS